MNRHSNASSTRRDFCAIIFALVLPSAITWAYFFQAAAEAPATQVAVFSVVKIVQFAFPLLWVLFVLHGRVRLRPENGRGLLVGVAFGVAVAVAMLALYFGFLRGSEMLADASREITGKVGRWGIDRVGEYAALGLFYALIHSLLEEYYWRWFVFGQLRRHIPLGPAILVSSLGFMAHHVLVLGRFFGFLSPSTWLFSACVAVGGAIWAWMYERTGSLLGPWISHLCVDAAIFAIGYDVVKHTLSA